MAGRGEREGGRRVSLSVGGRWGQCVSCGCDLLDIDAFRF